MLTIHKINHKILPILKRAKRITFGGYPDTMGLILIGSTADGTDNEESDIDIVWVKGKKLHYKDHFYIEEKLSSGKKKGRSVQIIPFTRQQILWHFKHSSTMSHAIKNGIVIYGLKNDFMSKLMKKKLSMPSEEWMSYWFQHWLRRFDWCLDSIRRERKYHEKFCKDKCSCTYMDDIARVAVNFAILFLELKRVIPLSKMQIKKAIVAWMDEEMMEGLNLALSLSGKDKFLTLEEMQKIIEPAGWLRQRLVRRFGSLKPAKKPL